MKLKDYILDHRYFILIYVLGWLLLEGILMLFYSPQALLIFSSFVFCMIGLILFFYDYFRKHSFYKQLFDILTPLDKKYLINEMIHRPTFLEGKYFYDSYEQILKSMNDEIHTHQRLSEEFKRYIELWIHEIKIPISTIQLVCFNHPSESTRKIKQQIKTIENDVDQVLYYVRSEVPEKDYHMGHYDLKEIVEESIRQHKDLLILNHMHIEIQVDHQMIQTDKKWLLFMLGQIISNAIKYKKDKNPHLIFTMKTTNNKVELTIEDNGIGISPSDLPRVFEKSFTGENGESRGYSTGMGLYLCKKLCLSLNHHITIESSWHHWTKVKITFYYEEPYVTLQ